MFLFFFDFTSTSTVRLLSDINSIAWPRRLSSPSSAATVWAKTLGIRSVPEWGIQGARGPSLLGVDARWWLCCGLRCWSCVVAGTRESVAIVVGLSLAHVSFSACRVPVVLRRGRRVPLRGYGGSRHLRLVHRHVRGPATAGAGSADGAGSCPSMGRESSSSYHASAPLMGCRDCAHGTGGASRCASSHSVLLLSRGERHAMWMRGMLATSCVSMMERALAGHRGCQGSVVASAFRCPRLPWPIVQGLGGMCGHCGRHSPEPFQQGPCQGFSRTSFPIRTRCIPMADSGTERLTSGLSRYVHCVATSLGLRHDT